MPELTFKNGRPTDAICFRCQTPGTDVRLGDGELYCEDCAAILLNP